MSKIIEVNIKKNIIEEYATNASINAISQKYNVSWATVKKIIAESEDQISNIRKAQQEKYISRAWDVVNVYLNKLLDPKTTKDAKPQDCMKIVSGMLERIQRQRELNIQEDKLIEEQNKRFKGV